MHNPFRYFSSLPEVVRLTVMMYIHYPLPLRQIEDLFFERGIDFRRGNLEPVRSSSVEFAMEMAS
jgi:transposase-like protein